MAQFLRPEMFNFEFRTNEQPELGQSKTLNFIKIQPFETGENGVDFQPIFIETVTDFYGEDGSRLD